MYLKNHVKYHPWHQLDSSMVKMNQDVMLTHFSGYFIWYIFQTVNYEYWLWKVIKIAMTVNMTLEVISRKLWYCALSNRFLWNVDWRKKCFLHWLVFEATNIRKKVAKWFIRIWSVVDIDNTRVIIFMNYSKSVFESGIIKKLLHAMDAYTLNI